MLVEARSVQLIRYFVTPETQCGRNYGVTWALLIWYLEVRRRQTVDSVEWARRALVPARMHTVFAAHWACTLMNNALVVVRCGHGIGFVAAAARN